MVEVPGIKLAIASAILSVCYPEEFTVVDYRVVGVLKELEVERLPQAATYDVRRYLQYCEACRGLAARCGISLRDLDRALWAKSWEEDLLRLIEAGDPRERTPQ